MRAILNDAVELAVSEPYGSESGMLVRFKAAFVLAQQR